MNFEGIGFTLKCLNRKHTFYGDYKEFNYMQVCSWMFITILQFISKRYTINKLFSENN